MLTKGVIIQKPNVKSSTIEVEYDKYASEQTIIDQKNVLGRYIPIVKFGNNTILSSKVIEFKIVFELFSLPTIYLTINDEHSTIREYLQNDLTTGAIRVGYQNWALKPNILFDDLYSYTGYGNDEIRLTGRIWNPKIYETLPQKAYKDNSIRDILHDISKTTDSGLYVYNNNLLTDVKYPHLIRSNMNYIDYLKYLVHGYTNNLWMMDANYYLHVGDYNTMVNNDVATYSLDWKTGKKIDPKKMRFFRNFMFGKIMENNQKSTKLDNTINQDDKILLSNYDVNTNYSEEYIRTKRIYRLFDENGEIPLKGQTDKFGIGEELCNKYSGFTSHILPYMKTISRKEMPKDIIKIYTEYIIPELNPFDVVELELYKVEVPGRETSTEFGDLDVEHSGRKLVIGWSISYDKNTEKQSASYLQEIICI